MVLALAALALLAPPAAAAGVPEQPLEAPEAVARTCADRALEGRAAGVAARTWTAPAGGLATVRLDGRPGGADWDLAVFEPDAGTGAVAASTSFGAAEQAGVWVGQGDELEIQACRRSGTDSTVPLEVDFVATEAPGADAERVSLESVALRAPGDLARLMRLGLDVTDDAEAGSATVALYSDAERATLAAAGFETTTLVEDVAAADRADRAAERQAEAAPGRSALPTGRETYRVMEDYTTEMKQLAEQRPDIVREVVIGTTLEGRPIEGLEIAGNVAASDGRPAYLNLGLVHAREWPSGELPMEFAHDLVAGYGSDPRITSLLDGVRVFVVPVVNVDGFVASRSFGTSPVDDNFAATAPLAVGDYAAYKRKNCNPTVPGSESAPCALRDHSGVDLNRNFGAYWGGPGSSPDVTSQSYRGSGPFSEPESEAVHRFGSALHPTVVVVNHTFTEDGKWLRQPGFDDVIGVTEDEAAMKQLGDAMAAASGWSSEPALVLGDITGATEDWNYFAQGAYGYTTEIRGTNFHGNYASSVVTEYVGDAAHLGLGVREAYLLAGERAAQAADHAVIEGSAPAGATLRLHKEFETPTSQPGLAVADVLDTTLAVAEPGTYSWHVNPSSRPDVEPGAGRTPPAETWTMTCEPATGASSSLEVAVGRGERIEVSFGAGCEPSATCAGRAATMVGSGALRGGPGRDVIAGGPGRDRIATRGGRDVACAGRGRDSLRGAAGADLLIGGPGGDLLAAGGGADRCRGGPGHDRERGC